MNQGRDSVNRILRPRRIAGWARGLLWTGAGLITMVALLLILLFSTDLGIFKPQIEHFASKQLGRRLSIEGRLQLELGREVLLVADEITLQNAPWAGVQPMVEVDRLEARLDLRSMFGGPAVVNLIDLRGVDIRLIEDEATVGNWELDGFRRTPAEADEKPTSAFGFLVREVAVDEFALNYSAPGRPQDLHVNVRNFHQSLGDDGFLDASLIGTVNDRDVSVDGRVGTWQALLAGRDVDFDITALLHEVTVTASGHVDDLLRPGRPTARFTVSGPDIAEFKRMFGLADEGVGAIDLQGEAVPEVGGPLRIAVLGKIGVSEIDARASVQNLRELQDVEVDLTATGPDLGELLLLAKIDQARDAPFAISVDAGRHGPELRVDRAEAQFADAKLLVSASVPRFPSLDDARFRVELEGAEFERFRRLTGLPGRATGPFSLVVEYGTPAGGNEPVSVEIRTELASLSANGELNAAAGYIGSTFEFQARAEDLARVGGAWNISHLPARPAQVSGSVEVLADSLRLTTPLVAELDGAVARISGNISREPWLFGSELGFEANGPDLAALVNLFYPVSRIPVLPYSASGRLKLEPGALVFRNVDAALGTSTMAVDGKLALSKGIVGSSFTVVARGPAFEELMRDLVDVDVRPGEYRLAGEFSVDDDAYAFQSVSLERDVAELDLDVRLGRKPGAPRLTFDLRTSGRDVRVLLDRFEGFSIEELPYAADARGEWRDTSVVLDKFDISIGDARASARGNVDYSENGAASRFAFEGAVPSLAALGSVDGRRFNDQAFGWKSTLTGERGRLEITDLDATIGQSRVTGTVTYQAGPVPGIDVELHSPSLVLLPLLEPLEEAAEAEPKSDDIPTDGRLIPDVAIPFDALRSLDGTLSLQFGEFRRGLLELTDLALDASLESGTLDIDRISFGARSGNLQGTARLDPADGAGSASLRLTARKFALGLHPSNRDLQITGDLDADLASTGTDLRSLAANANGVVLIDSRGGRFENSNLGNLFFGSFLQELFTTLNPFSKTDPYTTLECVIIPVEIQNGIVSSVPNSLIRTNKIEIATQGQVNLANEKLDISVRTVPRKGIVMSAAELVNPYFKIAGTMEKPVMTVDEQGVLITGGAAVATGGISIIAKAVWDRISRVPDPCTDTAARARKELGARWHFLLDAAAAAPN